LSEVAEPTLAEVLEKLKSMLRHYFKDWSATVSIAGATAREDACAPVPDEGLLRRKEMAC
jgi:hypothetical protein